MNDARHRLDKKVASVTAAGMGMEAADVILCDLGEK